jgi:hypothetical protein
MIRTTLIFGLFASAVLSGCQNTGTGAPAPQQTPSTNSYSSHFHHPGQRYDQSARAVDHEGFLVDRAGRRIGGKGYWVPGARDDVLPAGTLVDAIGHPINTPSSIPIQP